MAGRKRIAILVGQADEQYQDRFLQGFLEKAFDDDLDVFVFSMYKKYQFTPERERADSNIFNLINYDLFDALVLMKDTIQTAGVVDRLEETIHNKFTGPVISIEKESDYFPSVCTDGYSSIETLITHLIEAHGYRDIAFLTGKRWHPHSQLRLKAFIDTMEAHGLSVPGNRIIYGDFWYKSGEVCVEQLLGSGSLPEAIACANDQMAIGVCDELTKQGYRVPEDIAVIGFDSTAEGRTSPSTLTSTMLASKECGDYAERFLAAAMRDETIPPFDGRDELVIGRSCGCDEYTTISESALRDRWPTDISEEGYTSIYNTFADDLMKQDNITEFMRVIYEHAFQLRGARSYHICLQDSLAGLEKGEKVHLENNGYESKMIHVLKCYAAGVSGGVDLSDRFETSRLLPDIETEQAEPGVFFITPFSFEDECFGYSILDFGRRAGTYGEMYCRWMGDINRGFEGLRRSMILRAEELHRMAGGKSLSGPVSMKEKLTSEEKEEMDTVAKILDDNLFTYFFQPIIRVTDGSVFSYEALMRTTTTPPVSPLVILKHANMMDRLVDVEKATFLNVLAYVDANPDLFPNKKIFINSIPGVKLSDDVYEQVESLLKANSKVVVIELTEESRLTAEDIEEMKARYERLGIQTAVDDYGTGYSNVSNLLRIMPDYVKIDRSLISDIQDKPQKQYFVREIIGFCHENNMLALAEGVETYEELSTVISLGVDLIQGYYTAKPGPTLVDTISQEIVDEIVALSGKDEDTALAAERQYLAGKTNRISLSTLIREGYSEILIGDGNPLYRDVTIVGTPGMESNIRVSVAEDFLGELTLENACLSGTGSEPALKLEFGASLKLILHGENTMKHSGICVCDESSLEVMGTGNLSIHPDSDNFYGIGNTPDKSNGSIVLAQGGEIRIESSGKNGVCIGSGKGGSMELREGRFVIRASSDTCVGIGSLTGDVKPDIHDAVVDINLSVNMGVGIGSLEGDFKLVSENATIRTDVEGAETVGIGSLSGNKVKLNLWGITSEAVIRGDRATFMGALSGATDINLDNIQARVDIKGKECRFLGGDSESWIDIQGCDLTLDIETELDAEEIFDRESFDFSQSKYSFTHNGNDVVLD